MVSERTVRKGLMSADEPTQPAAPDDPLGILDWVIGEKFKVDSYLGGGGFGEVYGGHNVNLPEQRVVIKCSHRCLH